MEERRHFYHIMVLLIGLIVCLVFFAFYRYNPTYQFYASIGGVGYYVLWGLVHHHLEDRINPHIIMEYFLIGLVVMLLFALVLGI